VLHGNPAYEGLKPETRGRVVHVMRSRLALFLSCSATGAALTAQPTAQPLPAITIPGAVRYVLSAPALGGSRTVDIVQPTSRRPGVPVRVLFVLDGVSALPLAVEYLKLVSLECEQPSPVLVALSDGTPIGAPENRRGFDYTPTVSTVAWAKGEGGAAQFLTFLQHDVIPFVERTVGPIRDKALYGHSYGGLFGAYTLLQAPTLFNRMMLGSPSTFYDNGLIVKQLAADSSTAAQRAQPPRIFLTAGTEERWAVEGNAVLDTVLRRRFGTAMRLESISIPRAGHLVGSPISMLSALKWAYCRPE
jgi:predicted alpha/beta superfamily hydrolase